MINDWFSHLIFTLETAFGLMTYLWVPLIAASVAVTVLEKAKLYSMVPSSPLLGSICGILSPLPTVTLCSLPGLEKPGKAAFLVSSLLANPILLILIFSYLGVIAGIVYISIVFLIGAFFGRIAQVNPITVTKETLLSPKHEWWKRLWKHFCYIGFYTFLGVLIAAILQNFLSWTLYNLKIITQMPSPLKGLFILTAGPFYSCGGTWLPVLRELNGLGLGVGTALGFILFGQATRVGHLMALRQLFSLKLLIGLIVTTLMVGVVLAYLMN